MFASPQGGMADSGRPVVRRRTQAARLELELALALADRLRVDLGFPLCPVAVLVARDDPVERARLHVELDLLELGLELAAGALEVHADHVLARRQRIAAPRALRTLAVDLAQAERRLVARLGVVPALDDRVGLAVHPLRERARGDKEEGGDEQGAHGVLRVR